jgi:hypothetical protein
LEAEGAITLCGLLLWEVVVNLGEGTRLVIVIHVVITLG